MNTAMHPLRVAYRQAVRKEYGQSVGGSSDMVKVEAAAMKISKTGLDYRSYMDVAVRMLEPTVKYKGWKYPYWSVVVSDKTIARVEKLAGLVSGADMANDNPDEEVQFEAELSYAVEYVDWWLGKGEKPVHPDIEINPQIKSRVAEYLCSMWGVPCLSSNYNTLCKELDGR